MRGLLPGSTRSLLLDSQRKKIHSHCTKPKAVLEACKCNKAAVWCGKSCKHLFLQGNHGVQHKQTGKPESGRRQLLNACHLQILELCHPDSIPQLGLFFLFLVRFLATILIRRRFAFQTRAAAKLNSLLATKLGILELFLHDC